MVAKSNKAKSKRRPTAKSKAKRRGSKALLAKAASVRTANPGSKVRKASYRKSPPYPSTPALTVIATMGRVMDAYAELPARLAKCRSPMDIWLEQARFVQRVFSESTASTGRPLRAASR